MGQEPGVSPHDRTGRGVGGRLRSTSEKYSVQGLGKFRVWGVGFRVYREKYY